MFNLAADAVSALCVLVMLAAITINFLNTRPERRFRERRSPVATFGMTLFFGLLYATIRFRWGALETPLPTPARIIGLGLMLFGTLFNVWGRQYLKSNWADHVRVYSDQTLITTGPYRIVRHPLYASLIWMFYGAALAYGNPLAALENTLVFIPAMVYRSNLEEEELLKTFGEPMAAYRIRTGRFFPKLRRRAL